MGGMRSRSYAPQDMDMQGMQRMQDMQNMQDMQGMQDMQSMQGPQNMQGMQNMQGAQGMQGAQSMQGAQNMQGPQNMQGAQGMQPGHCPCIPQETTISHVFLAAAYVPFQKFCGNWPPIRSLIAGTIFAELFSPYCKREYVNLEPEVTCQMCPAGGGRY